jgi:lipoprotein-releasing system ATP-binding protein
LRRFLRIPVISATGNDAPAALAQASDERPRSRRGARVEVVGLHKEYAHGGRTVRVLHDVHLDLAAGDMVAIVGASGVGKSTLLQILGTLDLPTRGTIHINGEEITGMSPSRLAQFRNREIGFVFQFHHLLPEFTALENVMMPALIQRIPRQAAEQRARRILGRVGLGHRLTHKPSELSGGEQQRVALARAMVMEPSLLLADEPTGNLDKRTGEEIHDLFVELNRERGSTLLVVTHNPELAAMMPRCLRMLDGGGLAEVVPETPAAMPGAIRGALLDVLPGAAPESLTQAAVESLPEPGAGDEPGDAGGDSPSHGKPR